MVAFLLTACGQDTGGDLRIIGSRPGTEDGTSTSEPLPPKDPGTSGTSSTPAFDAECEPAPSTGAGDDLDLTFCRRVSPEEGPVCTTYRCTLYNLLGALGFVGSPRAPVVQYCDADPDGGLRLGAFDPVAEDLVAPALLPWRTCESSWGSGTLVETPEGTVAYWSAIEILDQGFGYPVWTAAFDGTTGTFGEPVKLESAPDAQFVEVVHGDADVLFVVGTDQTLYSMPLSVPGPAVALGDVDGRLTVTATSGAAIAATCDSGNVRLDAVGADGAPLWQRTVATSPCLEDLAPGVAALDDGTVLVAWSESLSSRAVVLAPDGAELARIDLGVGEAGAGPAAVSSGDRFLVLDGTGTGALIDAAGVVERTFHHAGIAARPTEVREIRIVWDGVDAAFLMAVELTVIGLGHVNTHDELEVSGAAIGAQ